VRAGVRTSFPLIFSPWSLWFLLPYRIVRNLWDRKGDHTDIDALTTWLDEQDLVARLALLLSESNACGYTCSPSPDATPVTPDKSTSDHLPQPT
jgi:hypothetical protein